MMWGEDGMKIITIPFSVGTESESRENLIKPWDIVNDGEGLSNDFENIPTEKKL